MLDPLLEPYAFVLPDAIDSREAPGERPWIEVGGLWPPGSAHPAWVELVRSRRYLVESDGAGRLRAFLPWSTDPSNQELPQRPGAEASAEAWRAAWPILRHLLAAERRRLAGDGELPALRVEVRAYRHLPVMAREATLSAYSLPLPWTYISSACSLPRW